MSKMFEMLQQAQRDQELLRQSAPQAALHSRNKDVLQRAGKDEQLFEIPVVPDAPTLEAAPVPSGFSRGEAYKLMQLLFMSPNSVAPRTVVFCGVDEEGGCDWVCAQTAELLSNFKQGPVCVVDANVSSPTLHTHFGLPNAGGLSAALVESGPVMDFTHAIGRGRLRVMTAGAPSIGLSSGIVAAPARLAARIRELRATFDYVLVNAPAATREPVTGHLSSLADGVVLIVEPSFTPREATRKVKEEIEAAGGRVLGVILHRRQLSLADRNNSQMPGPGNGRTR
jgi:hypothetical protein